jgi:thiamine transport system permease protein
VTQSRRVAGLLALAAGPVLVLGVLFVLPVGGMLAQGLWPDGSFDPGGVADVLARPRVHRVLWFTVWSSAVATLVAVALGLPAAYTLHRLALPGRRVVRAALLVPFVLPTVVVGVAFRQLLGEGGPLGFLGLDGTPVAVVAGLVFFNVAVVVRAVGAAWESLDPRPGEAAAALGASPAQVLRTVTLPALRPAIVGAASVVFLFCATAFGIVLTLGGVRYATVETEIYLLTTTIFDLQAAAALSILQIVVVLGLLALSARLRHAPDPTSGRVVATPRRVRRPDLLAVTATLLLLAALAVPVWRGPSASTGRGARPTTARSAAPATTAPCWCRPARPCSPACARPSTPPGWRCWWGSRSPSSSPAGPTRPPSAGSARRWTASSCCRSASAR